MKYSEHALNVLTALSFKGIGKAWINENLNSKKNIDEISRALNRKISDPISADQFEGKRRRFEEIIIGKLDNYCDGFIALGDDEFPQHRGNVKPGERPVFLYYKGDISLLGIDNKNISVIGLLNPSDHIEDRERNIVAEFIKNGATIISGLAFGCDSIAHQETLEREGKTVAILPGPLDNILPTRHKELADQIARKNGLLVTEYGKNHNSTMDLNGRYKERDRLQALFCDAIVLAASYAQDSAKRMGKEEKLDSGARHAMAYAKEYGIPRAVMYDKDIDNMDPMLDLNREIINNHENVIILSNGNYHETVKEILKMNASGKITTLAKQKTQNKRRKKNKTRELVYSKIKTLSE